MFKSINDEFNRVKRDRAANRFIVESVLGVDEVIPGSEDEIDDIVDIDSVPEEAYKKLDAELDKIVDDPNYDDVEAEELYDDDDDDISDDEIEAVVNEAASGVWYDDETIGANCNATRKGDNGDSRTHAQPIFHGNGQDTL